MLFVYNYRYYSTTKGDLSKENGIGKQMKDILLLTDREVADLLSFSVQWVKQQRHKRQSGKPHNFTIDPVSIGSSPRYKLQDVLDWLDKLKEQGHD